MKYLKLIIFTYLLALISIPISNLLKIDIQFMFRVPGLNIRFFDVALIIMLIAAFSSNIYQIFNVKSNLSKLLNILMLLFLVFQFFNFFRTLGDIEINAQLAFLGAYLSIFIVYYINNFLSKDQILKMLKDDYFLIILIMLFYNFSLLFLYLSGRALIVDDSLGQRLMFDAVGLKESIGLLNVSFFSLLLALFRKEIFTNSKIKGYFSLFFLILFVVISLFSFHRGTIFGIMFCVTVYILYMSKVNLKRNLTLILVALFTLAIIYSSYNTLLKGGIDPIQNFKNTIEFALDTNNPVWDKGREFSRILALQIWYSNFWFGIGFSHMDLVTKVYNVATPHHLVFTSLMHNGLIGSIFFLGIYSIFYIKTIKLTKKLFKGIIPKNEVIIVIILLTVSFLWLMIALTQEVQLERYSSALQYIFFGAIIKIDDYYELQSKNRK